ncbi:XRE family transcriptional regulator [Microbacterium sp.]|uniref:helix-turn-helix domain-containing protein n=1 Tax=Microbacterium sp. TaxID=51671 RepID=UPI0028122B11|nr:XRE family transcriptional regulator [Microbacterium sp.]
MSGHEDVEVALEAVGPRLKWLRQQRGLTLTALAEATGISKSTLSRLETGQREPSLKLLFPLAQAHRVPLDELVGAPEVADPRVRLKPRRIRGRVVIPLTPHAGAVQAWKILIPGSQVRSQPRTHEGYEWLYVLSGTMRLMLGRHDVRLGPGEVAEFDTHVPHWFGSADGMPVEVLSLFGRQGERARVRTDADHRSEQ